MSNDEDVRRVLFEVAGLFTLIRQGIPVPNLNAQIDDVLDKVGKLLMRDSHDA